MPEQIAMIGLAVAMFGAAFDIAGLAWFGMILACCGFAAWLVDMRRESR
jgi:hypothetical protein